MKITTMNDPAPTVFKKLIISDKLDDLLRYHPDAFLLLTLIARRARREPYHGLKAREARIGDYDACGLTERRYRTSKRKLEKFQIATFKATNKGTVATLCDSKYYDINKVDSDEQSDRQETNKRRTRDEQETTKKKERSKELKKKQLPSQKKPDTLPKPTKQEVEAWWNSIAKTNGLPKVRAITDSRWSNFGRRFSEGMWEARKELTETISKSPFLNGASERMWRMDFGWLVENDTNWLKIVEGKYLNGSNGKTGDGPQTVTISNLF